MTDLIPEQWRLVKLGEVCSFQGGTQPPRETFVFSPTKGYVRLLQIRDFESEDHPAFVNTGFNLRYVTEEDVLLARYGASIGKIFTGKAGAINVALVKTIPDPEAVCQPFLFYFLQTNRVQRYLVTLGGRSAQAGFNQGELNRIELSLPPLPEQRAISRALRSVQQAKESRQREAALERERKAALMQHLFTKGTRGEPTKQTEIGEMPESWEVVRLDSLGALLSGGTPDKSRNDWWEGLIPWASPKDMKTVRLLDTQDHISCQCRPASSPLCRPLTLVADTG